MEIFSGTGGQTMKGVFSNGDVAITYSTVNYYEPIKEIPDHTNNGLSQNQSHISEAKRDYEGTKTMSEEKKENQQDPKTLSLKKKVDSEVAKKYKEHISQYMQNLKGMSKFKQSHQENSHQPEIARQEFIKGVNEDFENRYPEEQKHAQIGKATQNEIAKEAKTEEKVQTAQGVSLQLASTSISGSETLQQTIKRSEDEKVYQQYGNNELDEECEYDSISSIDLDSDYQEGHDLIKDTSDNLMQQPMKIYNDSLGNIQTDLCIITSNFANVKLNEIMVNSIKKKPKSLSEKFPALQSPEGIFDESAAISLYIAEIGEGKLHGRNALEKDKVNMWIDFSKTTIQPQLYYFSVEAGDSNEFNNAAKEIKEHVKTINLHLQDKTHLVGNRITIADIALSLMIIPLFQTTVDRDFFRKEVPNAADWLESLIKLPEFVSRIGNNQVEESTINNLLVQMENEVKDPSLRTDTETKGDDGEDNADKKLEKEPLDLFLKQNDQKRSYSQIALFGQDPSKDFSAK